MNDCNCKPKNYQISLGCCQPVLGPIEAYYTKWEIDRMISGQTSGCCITPEEVDEKIEEAISGITPCDLSEYWTSAQTESAITSAITVVEGEIPSLSGYATEQWVLDKHYISGVDLSDYATKQWVLDKHYLTEHQSLADYYTKLQTDVMLDLKLDASAYTPTDLSNYYTKSEVYTKNEVDDKIASAETFDPTQYYTKSESDTRFALKSEIPNLSGYATTEWVTNQNFVTNTTIQQYITNLQQQINSIIESVSGCCSQTGQTEYRWITMTGANDYACSGTTKMTKEKEQSSTDGLNWTDTGNYRTGSTVLETNSSDCGYIPAPQYRWYTAPSSDYMCSGTTKYQKQYYQVSTDSGNTWSNVTPTQTRAGSVIETNSTDCGYIAPQYRWYTSQSEYLCSGTTKYQKQYYQVSTDGGVHWDSVSPTQTRTGNKIEDYSTDCGYEPLVMWTGSTAQTMCSGTSKYYKLEKWVSYDGGNHYTKVTPVETKPGKLIASNSYHCGYSGTSAMKVYDESNHMTQINCESLSSSTVTGELYNDVLNNEIVGHGWDCYYHFEFSDCVTSLSGKVTDTMSFTFPSCTRTVELGSNITYLGSSFEGCTALTSVTIHATTPPTLKGDYIFRNSNNAPIYVPASSVNAYKTASGWSAYADRIQAIP